MGFAAAAVTASFGLAVSAYQPWLQFWDPNHLLATQMKKDARAPQPVQDCCIRSGILWDLAAVYGPGSTWSDRMPPATVFNGPVVDIVDAIEDALGSSRAGTRRDDTSIGK
jgi:hypothetical protein